MKLKILKLFFVFFTVASLAQPKLELNPNGFQTIELNTPNRSTENLIQMSRAWAPFYNKKGYDVSDVTQNSLTISARKNNAYYFLNQGETYFFDIHYILKVNFKPNNTYTLSFIVNEIYDNQQLLKTTVASFFSPDGKLKEDFEKVKPSLEKTANDIAKSFINYVNTN